MGRTPNLYRPSPCPSQAASELGLADDVVLQGDSQLVVRQLSGIYSVNSVLLLPLFSSIRAEFKHVKATHVLRGCNVDADRLANLAQAGGLCCLLCVIITSVMLCDNCLY